MCNLSNKSPRCHHAKHHGWDVTRDELTGHSNWHSPLGHTYLRPGVWQAPPDLPHDTVLPPPRLLQEQPGPFYDDSTWNTPLGLPPRKTAPTENTKA